MHVIFVLSGLCMRLPNQIMVLVRSVQALYRFKSVQVRVNDFTAEKVEVEVVLHNKIQNQGFLVKFIKVQTHVLVS
jgi:hypothetical protein